MDWGERFLEERIRKGIKTEKDSSLDEYKSVLSTVRNKFHLELDKASLEEINEALVQMRLRYKPDYYFHLVAFIKAVLKVLNRTRINEQIAYPKLPDRKTQVEDDSRGVPLFTEIHFD